MLVAAVGYLLGLAATLAVSRAAGGGGTAVVLRTPPVLLFGMAPVALAMCLIAGIAAAARAMLVAPAKVFR